MVLRRAAGATGGVRGGGEPLGLLIVDGEGIRHAVSLDGGERSTTRTQNQINRSKSVDETEPGMMPRTSLRDDGRYR